MGKLGKIFFALSILSLALFGVTKFILGQWIPFMWVELGLFLLSFIIGIYVERQFLKDFLSMKTTKNGLNMGATIFLVLLFLVMLNWQVIRHPKTIDLSLAQINSLSPQSIQLVKSLKSTLKVVFFYKNGVEGNEQNRQQFRELIKKYQDHSNQIQLEFVEMNENPDLTKNYGVDQGHGVAFLDFEGRRNRIEKIDEQEITSALVKVTREKNKTIYFSIGHAERDIHDDKEASGLGFLRSLLENSRYQLKTIAFNQLQKIPDDADLIVISGPKQNFLDFEIDVIVDYLKKGGALFIALESQESFGLEKIVNQLGLELKNNFIFNILDTPLGKAVNQGPTMGVIFSGTNQITKSFGKNEMTLFRYPMAIQRTANIQKEISIDEIVRTGPNSIAFKDLKPGQGQGNPGPFTVVVSVQGQYPGSEMKKDFNMILAGDADFMSNQLLGQNLNRDIVLNSIASLVKEENLISITPKEVQVTQLTMTPNKWSFFILGFILPVPMFMLIMAIVLWLKRRNA